MRKGLVVLLLLLVAVGCGSDDGDDGSPVEVIEITHEGVTYRCLESDHGLWCERIWNEVEPSHDCGPNGDQLCSDA